MKTPRDDDPPYGYAHALLELERLEREADRKRMDVFFWFIISAVFWFIIFLIFV